MHPQPVETALEWFSVHFQTLDWSTFNGSTRDLMKLAPA